MFIKTEQQNSSPQSLSEMHQLSNKNKNKENNNPNTGNKESEIESCLFIPSTLFRITQL